MVLTSVVAAINFEFLSLRMVVVAGPPEVIAVYWKGTGRCHWLPRGGLRGISKNRPELFGVFSTSGRAANNGGK